VRTRPDAPTARPMFALVAGILLVVGTACGPTVPHQSGTAGAVAASPGAGLGVPSGTTSTTGGKKAGSGAVTGAGGSTTGGSMGGTTGGVAGGGSGGGSLPTGTGGGKHLAVAPSAPGVTDTTIYIGSYYNKNQGQGNAAFGASGLDQGDARKPQNVMIDWVNSHGGVAGRKLSPIYYGFDASGTGPPSDQQDQAACAKYTQDNKVFAMIVQGSIFDECAKREGAVDLNQDGTPSIYKKYPDRIDIESLNMVRAWKVTVDGAAQLGYFNAGAKIGVVAWDGPDYKEAINDGLLPELRRHGLSLATQPYFIAEPQTFQDLGSASAAVNNAVLKFATLGIDHVFVMDGQAGLCGGSCLSIEWLKRAESQQYYPDYAFNDKNSAIELAKLGILSKRQAVGSIYINWTDAGPDYEKGLKPNPQLQECIKIMKAHNIDMSNANQQGAAYAACEDMWFMQTVGEKLTSMNLDLSTPNFINAVDALGYSYLSPLSYANYFSAQQHDGAAGVRHGKWVPCNDLNCYKWIGTVYKVG